MSKLRFILVVLALTPSLRALDVRTLDGKTYQNCTVSLVEPDALCVLFPGGGARVKFINLPENLRDAYGYDSVKAAAYEQAQASKRQREDARWQLARIQAEARRKAAASNAVSRTPPAAAATTQMASSPSARTPAAYGGRNQGQGGYGGNSQNSSSGTGSEYVGVSLASAGNAFSGQGSGAGSGSGSGYGGRNQGGSGGTGAIYYGVRLAP